MTTINIFLVAMAVLFIGGIAFIGRRSAGAKDKSKDGSIQACHTFRLF